MTPEQHPQLVEINSKPLETLEKAMRPEARGGASAGFLGRHESLAEVLVNDQARVEAMGLTHEDIATPLRAIVEHARAGELNSEHGFTTINFDGKDYYVKVLGTRGWQDSPFEDGTKGISDYWVANMHDGTGFYMSELHPEFVGRYGFYEGEAVEEYRLDPEKVVATFTPLREHALEYGSGDMLQFEPIPEDDPVVALLASEAEPETTLTTFDQLERYLTATTSGLLQAVEGDLVFKPETKQDLVSYLAIWGNNIDSAGGVYVDISAIPDNTDEHSILKLKNHTQAVNTIMALEFVADGDKKMLDFIDEVQLPYVGVDDPAQALHDAFEAVNLGGGEEASTSVLISKLAHRP